MHPLFEIVLLNKNFDKNIWKIFIFVLKQMVYSYGQLCQIQTKSSLSLQDTVQESQHRKVTKKSLKSLVNGTVALILSKRWN